MLQVGIPFEQEPLRKKRHLIWVLFLLIALIFHGLLFSIQFQWANPFKTPNIDLQQIDPHKLESIRKKWKEKSLLLNRKNALPSEKEIPPESRYFSDRNTRVKKEQRARDTQIIPAPGKAQKSVTRAPIDLGYLGIPFRLNHPQNRTTSSQQTSQLGGEQALLEKDLPTGSENILNTQESIYYSFYARLYETIGPIWKSRIREVPPLPYLRAGDYRTEVDVVLDQEGSVLEVHRLRSSGIEEFDRAIEDAWKKVGPFPNPPQALLNSQNQIHTGWSFTVSIQPGLTLQGGTPIRNY